MFDKKETTVISVEGMHCNHCKAKVEATLKAVKGVKDFKVVLETAEATVSYVAKKVEPSAIAEAVTAAGFPAKVK